MYPAQIVRNELTTAYCTAQSNDGFLRTISFHWLAFARVCFNHGAIHSRSPRAYYFLLILIFHNQYASDTGC